MLAGKKVPYFRLFAVFLVLFILFRVVNNTELLVQGFRYIVSLTSYFIWGFAIAYLLNPFMSLLERRFKMGRVWSLLIVYVVFIGFIVFLIMILTPIVMRNLRELLEHIPRFIIQTQAVIEQYIANIELYHDLNIIEYFESNINEILDEVNVVFVQAVNLTSTLLKLIFGIILSIYMLKDKEGFVRQSKRLLYALLRQEQAAYTLNVGKRANRIFTQYLVGKTLDSLIIGAICFIGLLILRIPYPLLISLVIAATNMIPYFGPFIGLIPAFIITLFFSPIKALWVVVFIILLQQLDGWVIGPRILGDSVGLSPFWIIVAIILGGGLFGIPGMLLGVPVLAVIKMILDEYIERRLRDKKDTAITL